MDRELDQVLCTVLSLEEDYPTRSSPLRNLEHFTSIQCMSPNSFLDKKTQKDLQDSIIIQQHFLKIYNLLKFQQELQTRRPMSTREPSCRAQKPVKRKLYEENEQCKHPCTMTDPDLTQCKKRTTYTKEETILLLNEFHCNPYPDFISRRRIARIMGISEPRIQVWFQNRRSRHLSKPKTSQNLIGKISATGAPTEDSQQPQSHEGLQIQENTLIFPMFPNTVPLFC
ncbi:homeobox protein siamois-like [Gastrophryne carolinensis]